MNCRGRRILGSLVLVVGLGTSAFGQMKSTVDAALPAYRSEDQVSGHLTISGSDTMQPVMLRLAAEFRRHQPDTKVALEGGGSDAAIERFVEGIALVRTGEGNDSGHDGARQAVFLASSRELTPEELREFVSRYGYEPIPVPIAVDAVAIYVHRDNPLEGLTLAELEGIFSSAPKGASRRVERWGDLNMGQSWGNAPIHMYGRDLNSGTRAFLKEHILKNAEFRSTVQEVPGAASMILAISRDPLGIGYGGIGWQTSGVRPLPLAAAPGQPYAAPSRGSVSDDGYPLRRPLYLYINKAPNQKLSSGAKEFLRFVYSREGQEAVAKAGFYPLRQEQTPRVLADLITHR